MQKKSRIPSYPFAFGPFGTPTLAYDEFRSSKPVRPVLVPSGWEAWLVTRYADVCAVHKNPLFSRAEALRVGAALSKDGGIELTARALQNMDGQQHAALRRVFASHYSHEHVPRWIEVVRNGANEVVDSLKPGICFDFRADFFEPVTQRTAEELFGFPVSRGPRILELFFDNELVRNLHDRLLALFRSQEGVPDSFIGSLRDLCQEGRISESDVLVNLLVLATASFEALGGPFLGGVFALLRRRSQWDACLSDRSLVPNAIDEMLRLFPNGDGQFLRVATEDVVLSGVRIRRGEAVLAPVSAANTDPDIFSDPRRFDVRRPNSNKHIAFGVGRHRCLAGLVATVWMQTALEVLLTRLSTLRLAIEAESVTYRRMPLISIMDRLPVTY